MQKSRNYRCPYKVGIELIFPLQVSSGVDFYPELLKFYKTLIRPVVSYGAEAWTLAKKEEQALLIF